MSAKDTPSSTAEENTFLKRRVGIRLVDDTRIYAREYVENSEEARRIIRGVKYVFIQDGEKHTQYFDDTEEFQIHQDAIEVFLILHKGGSDE